VVLNLGLCNICVVKSFNKIYCMIFFRHRKYRDRLDDQGIMVQFLAGTSHFFLL
jgi:hypothetical protein